MMTTPDENCTIVFLDFDGVTHREPCAIDELFGRLPLIDLVLREFDHVRIVVSSSWRQEHSLDEINGFLSAVSPDVARRVVGMTPLIKTVTADWIPGSNSRYERQWECETWLKTNAQRGQPWVAIDDRDYWFEPQCRHLVLTDGRVGFTEENALSLRELLAERAP